MKNVLKFWSILSFALAAILGFGVTSCSNEESDEVTEKPAPVDEEVQVYFVYTLDTSVGTPMTRTSGDEVFNQFYDKIKTGELVPDDYSLTLTETTTGAKYVFKGKWSENNLVTIRTGKYKVEGSSTASGYIQDKCSISINEEISITASSSAICLNASYECSLLVFTDTNIKNVYYFDSDNGTGGYQRQFYSFSTYKYAFVINDILQQKTYFGGTFTNESTFRIYVAGLQFEKGKYYVYNAVSNSFNLPKMVQGE